MKLSVSNLAWNQGEADDALRVLKRYQIGNLEVVPTLLFENIFTVDETEIKDARRYYGGRGFTLVAMQSLLFGAPAYSIFDNDEKVAVLLGHLERNITIARLLGVGKLVFGSPKNRLTRSENKAENETKAMYFFKALSQLAEKAGIIICLEANPVEYGGNFIVDTFEAIEFVKKIGHHNLRLNLDTGAILMNKDNLEEVIKDANGLIEHIHISAPYIGEICTDAIDHDYMSGFIKNLDYSGFISLEMKKDIAGGTRQEVDSNMQILERNLKVFVQYYGNN